MAFTKVLGPGINTTTNVRVGIITASNFKTGTSNLHNVGVEVAGINVLGADTPIGSGSTVYDSGDALFTGVVTATSFSGTISGGQNPITCGNISAGLGTFTQIHVGSAVTANASGINVTGVVTATTFKGALTGNVTGNVVASAATITTLNATNLTGTLSGVSTNLISAVGIQSAGLAIGAGITQLNFVGAGNTFKSDGTTVDISIAGGGGGAVGTGTDKVFYENDVTVSQSYDISGGKNAMTAGPIALGAGVTVVIPAGSVWTVV